MPNTAVPARTSYNISRIMHDHFLRLKTNLELAPTLASSIATRHNALRTYLKNNLPEMEDSKLIGSLQRRTKISPGEGKKLDIDILVIMGAFYNWLPSGGVTPQAAINTLHAAVDQSDRYRDLDPVPDPPTVTLAYADDIEVELVLCVYRYDRLRSSRQLCWAGWKRLLGCEGRRMGNSGLRPRSGLYLSTKRSERRIFDSSDQDAEGYQAGILFGLRFLSGRDNCCERRPDLCFH